MSGKGIKILPQTTKTGIEVDYPSENWDKPYTVTCWARHHNGTIYFVGWDSRYIVHNHYIRYSATNHNIWFDVNENTRFIGYICDVTLEENRWYHFAFVNKFESGKAEIWIDGVKQTLTTQYRNTTGTENKFIIGSSKGLSNYLESNSDIDDYMIFNRALSEKEILGLYLARGNTPIYYTLKDYQLASIDDDGIISPLEKKQLLAKWHEIYNADNVTSALPTSSITAQGEYKSVIDDAVSLGILSITAIDNYRQSANALRDLFWGTNGYLNNLKAQSATRTDINLDNLLANYQKALQDARTAIGQQQASVASALGVSNSNPFCLIPVNATTGNPDYTNTGTRLQVFNGTTQLTPISSGTLADNEWKVTVTRDHITEGNQTLGDGYIDFGDVSAMTDKHADLTFNVVAKVNGVENTIYTVQKFTQAQEGADGRIYDLRTEQGVVKKSPGGVLTPSSITVQAYSWTASNPPALFGTGDLKAYENNVQVGTTVSQGNSITVSPSGNYPVVVKLFKHGTNTVLDVINIPVLNEVKGDTGETGAQGPQGLKGDTGAKGDKGDKGDTGATGAKGDKGDTGAQGLKGEKGNPGERGSKEFSGTEINKITGSAQTETLTTASSGIDSSDMPIYVGDTYVNTLTNDVWNCTTAGTPSTAKWTYQGRRKSDKDDTNLFRFFDAEHDYTNIPSTFTKAVQTAENPFGYNDKILHITNTNGTQYSRAIPYYKSIRVNSDKKYRYVLYIKQNDSKRRDYFGIVDNQSGGGVAHITSLSGGTVSNGYFGSSTNLGTLGNWYMIVAYVMPYSASTTTAPSDAGVYNCSTKRKIGTTVTNYKWKNDGDFIITHNGTLIRYADTAKTDTSSADIYDVRFDECNGNEPSIDELLRIDTSVKNKGAWTANTDYYIGDIVSHSGSSYICKTNHNSGSAWATTNWDLLSDKGDTGTDGASTYYSSASATTSTTSITKSTITIPSGQVLKVGDIVIAGSYLTFRVTNVGTGTTCTVQYVASIRGAQGVAGKKIKVSDYPLRTWDANNWTNYSTAGNTANWLNTDHDFAIGDILIVPAKLSSEGNIIGQSYNEVTENPYADGNYWRIPCKVLYGIKGEKGQSGEDGNGISSISYYYARTNSQTAPSASSVTSTTIPTLDATYKYLWQKEVISYTDGTNKTTVALIGATGNTGKATHVSDYTSTRTWTNAQWNDYTTKGRSTGWSNVTGSPTIKIGDIFIVYATLSEQGNITGQVYCEVTGITGSGSSWTITSKTLYGVKGEKGQTGDKGDDGSAIYITSADTSSTTTSININTITLPTGHTIKVDDMVIGKGRYIYKITAINSTTVTVSLIGDLQPQDGKNAITMTSSSTPSGDYVGQLGYYGSQLFKWNGNSWDSLGMATTGDISNALTDYTKTEDLSDVATSGDYDDLLNKPENLSDFTDDIGIQTSQDVNSAIENNTSTYTPKYLGKYASASSVPTAHKGDWYFNTTNVALYTYSGTAWGTTAVTYNETNKYMFNACASDILSYATATANSQIKAFAVAYIGELFVNHIKVGTNGSIRGGDRYNEDGSLADSSKLGFYFGTDGSMNGLLGCALTDNVLIGDGAGASMIKNTATIESEYIDRENVYIGLHAGDYTGTHAYYNRNISNVGIGRAACYGNIGNNTVGIGNSACRDNVTVKRTLLYNINKAA